MRIEIDRRGIVYKRNLTLKGGLGFKRGEYLRMLKPGKHSISPREQVELHDKSEFTVGATTLMLIVTQDTVTLS